MRRRDVSERALAGLLLALVASVGILGGIVLDRTLLQPAPAGTPEGSTAVRSTARDAPTDESGEPPSVPSPRALDRRLGLPGEGAFVDWLDDRLELEADQRRQLEEIVERRRGELRAFVDSVRPRFREITRATRRDVRAVLTPEQQRRLRRLLAERARQRRPAGEDFP